MSYKSFIPPLIVIIFIYGTESQMTLYPDLATALPEMKFEDNQIQCFNKYWEIKMGFEKEERQRWNCPLGNCPKNRECCAAYVVFDKTKGVTDMPQECKPGAKALIKRALPNALEKIKKECEPDYKHESEECRVLESKLGSEPKGESSGNEEPPPPAPEQNGDRPKPKPQPAETVPQDKPKGPEPTKKGGKGNGGVRPEIGAAFGLTFGLLSVLMSQFI